MSVAVVQNEGTATDKTDWGEIQDTHKAYKSYRPHENAVQTGCPK